MNACCNTIRYSIDRLELSYRFGKNTHFPVQVIDDLLELLRLRDDVTVGKLKSGSHREGASYNRCTISMKQYRGEKVTVETGTANNKWGIFPYAKFSFNHARIFRHEGAMELFLSVMDDLLPGGGYQELIDEGNVLYAEYAIDFNFICMNEVDIFSPSMDRGDVYIIGADGNLETVSISNSKEKPRQLSFTVYDKKKQLRAKKAIIVRGGLVRIEAKRRFQSAGEVQEVDAPTIVADRKPIKRLDRCTQRQTGLYLHLSQRCTLHSQSTRGRLTGSILRYKRGGQGETYQDATSHSAHVVEPHRTLGGLLYDVTPRYGKRPHGRRRMRYDYLISR